MSGKAGSLRGRFAAVGGAEATAVPHIEKVRRSADANVQPKDVRPTFPMSKQERDGLAQEAAALARVVPNGADGKPVASTHIVRGLIALYRKPPAGLEALRPALEAWVRRDRGVGE
jgi:hypothetical protein